MSQMVLTISSMVKYIATIMATTILFKIHMPYLILRPYGYIGVCNSSIRIYFCRNASMKYEKKCWWGKQNCTWAEFISDTSMLIYIPTLPEILQGEIITQRPKNENYFLSTAGMMRCSSRHFCFKQFLWVFSSVDDSDQEFSSRVDLICMHLEVLEYITPRVTVCVGVAEVVDSDKNPFVS